MADSFARLPGPTHAAPISAVGDGHPHAPGRPTHPATVIAVVGPESGGAHPAVRHEVRLLGQIVPLLAPTELPVGSVLEVLALRAEGGLQAFLPGGHLPSSPGGLPAAPVLPEVPSLDLGSESVRNPAPKAVSSPDLPVSVSALLQAEGLETEAGVRSARRLIGLGVEPSGALLRGGAAVEGSSSTRSIPLVEIAPAVAGAIDAAVLAARAGIAIVDGDGQLASLFSRLPSFAAALRDATLHPSEHAALTDRLAATITQAVEQALARDPRLAAIREAIAALRSETGVAPEAARHWLTAAVSERDLAEGLTPAARRRGIELLMRLERRAIEEHPIHREVRPLLRDILDRSNVLSYRVTIELAEREGGVRADPDNTWYVETPEGRPVRVRRNFERGGEERSGTGGGAQRFRIETRGWGLGEIVVEGVEQRRLEGTAVGLELSAEEERTRRAIAAELEALIESFEGTGLDVSGAVVPWRTGKLRNESSVPPDQESSSGGPSTKTDRGQFPGASLDRRV